MRLHVGNELHFPPGWQVILPDPSSMYPLLHEIVISLPIGYQCSLGVASAFGSKTGRHCTKVKM